MYNQNSNYNYKRRERPQEKEGEKPQENEGEKIQGKEGEEQEEPKLRFTNSKKIDNDSNENFKEFSKEGDVSLKYNFII